MKRLLDITVSALALLLLAPVLALIALAVAVSLGRPVLFRQQRPGLHGKPFELIKFRTMKNAAGPGARPLPDSQRLTSTGRFLRSTSLDELPELWNILKGEMSLVGPRPLLMAYLDRYTPEQARRHDVRPGLTGWAQINGRNTTSWPHRLAMDVWYVDNRSFALDLKILAITAWKTLRREGISAEGEATMSEFRGNTPSGPDPTPAKGNQPGGQP